MLKKVVLPKKFDFFIDDEKMQKFFSEKSDIFFPGNKKITLKEIDHSAIHLGGVLKIFIKYNIQIEINDKTESRLIYGIHRFGGTNQSEFLILRHIWNQSLIKKSILINRPLYFFNKHKLILYDELTGSPLNEKLKNLSTNKALKFILPVTDLIAHLHVLGARAPFRVKNSFQKEKNKANIFLKEFIKFFPDQKSELTDLIKKIFIEKNKIIKTFSKSFILIHNDLTLGNLVYQEKNKKIGLIDFSESCTNDPLVDVGSFLSQIDYLKINSNISSSKIEKYKKIFINNYLKRSKIKYNKINDRLSTYQAWGSIQNAIFALAPAEKNHNIILAQKFINQASQYMKNIKI